MMSSLQASYRLYVQTQRRRRATGAGTLGTLSVFYISADE